MDRSDVTDTMNPQTMDTEGTLDSSDSSDRHHGQ